MSRLCIHLFSLIALCVPLVVTGCASHMKAVYVNTADTGVTYISKEEPPLRFEINGKNWKVSQLALDSLLFQDPSKPLRRINFLNHPLKRCPYYQVTLSEGELLDKHYAWESQFHLTHQAHSKSEILGSDVAGPITPNRLWCLETPKSRMFSLDMIKNDRLMTIMVQDAGAYPQGTNDVLEIFRSIKLLTREEVDHVLKTETNQGQNH